MPELILVPEVAAGATEATLIEWLVHEGDTVAVGDVLAVLETDKAQVEIAAETAGVIRKLLFAQPSPVDVGAPMAVLTAQDEVVGDMDALLKSMGVAMGGQGSTSAEPSVPQMGSGLESPEASAEAGKPSMPGSHGTDHRFISPISRRLLREANIDPSSLTGTGPNGRIVRRDVEAAIAVMAVPTTETVEIYVPEASSSAKISGVGRDTAGSEPVTIIPHTRLRRAVARRLTLSKQTVPHFYLRRAAAIDELLRMRQRLIEQTGTKVSVNDLVLKAVAVAHVEVPDANVVWTEEHMLQPHSVDIAVAIASEKGLVTPVLRSVEHMSLGTLSNQVRSFVKRANEGELRQQDLEGGTITVTNLGMYGVDEFSAIINPPHAAILAVGAGQQTPRVVDGQLVVGTVMSLVLSVDHRAIDGALAAQWMRALVGAIEHPYKLLV